MHLLLVLMNVLIITFWHRNGRCINLHICYQVFRIQEYNYPNVYFPVSAFWLYVSPRKPGQYFDTISRTHFNYYTL